MRLPANAELEPTPGSGPVRPSGLALLGWRGSAWFARRRITGVGIAFLPLCVLLTGCYTSTLAPGAIGRVLDSDTGSPVGGARVTRVSVPRWPGHMGTPSDELPVTTVESDRHGAFNLPPDTHTQIAFMYLPNPRSMPGSFSVSADGYATNEFHGVATSRTFWRVDLGRVLLRRL